jgi:hypothetical protein
MRVCSKWCGNSPFAAGLGFVCFAALPQNTQTPPEWAGTHLRAFPVFLQAEFAAG